MSVQRNCRKRPLKALGKTGSQVGINADQSLPLPGTQTAFQLEPLHQFARDVFRVGSRTAVPGNQQLPSPGIGAFDQ